MANYFKSILLHKNWRGEGKLLLKNNVQYVIARAGFTLSWAPGTLGFSQYCPAKYWRRPTKVLYERGATGTEPYVKSVTMVIALHSQKG